MASSEIKKKIQAEGIGKRLRGLREVTNLSVRAFAKQYGVSYSLWSDYENDRRKPNATTIKKLCSSFNVTADWLIFGDSAQQLKALSEQEVLDAAKPNHKTAGVNDRKGSRKLKTAGVGAVQARKYGNRKR